MKRVILIVAIITIVPLAATAQNKFDNPPEEFRAYTNFFTEAEEKEFELTRPYGVLIKAECDQEYGGKHIEDVIYDALHRGYKGFIRLNGFTKGHFLPKFKGILTNVEYPLQVTCFDPIFQYQKKPFGAAYIPLKKDEFPRIRLNALRFREINNEYKKPDWTFLLLSSTFFHEFLHHSGEEHSEGVVLLCACDICFFLDTRKPKDVLQNACDICAGKWLRPNNLEYLEKMSTLGEENVSDEIGNFLYVMVRYPEFGRKKDIQLLFLRRVNLYESMFSWVWAQHLQRFFNKNNIALTAEESEFLEKLVTNKQLHNDLLQRQVIVDLSNTMWYYLEGNLELAAKELAHIDVFEIKLEDTRAIVIYEIMNVVINHLGKKLADYCHQKLVEYNNVEERRLYYSELYSRIVRKMALRILRR